MLFSGPTAEEERGGGRRGGGDDRDWSPTRCPAWRGYDILSESALKNPLRASHTVSMYAYACVRVRVRARVSVTARVCLCVPESMRYVLDWVSLVVIMYMRRRRGRAQAAPMHAGWLERTDQPSSSAFCQTLYWPLMVLFSRFFFAWPDRSYLNQPRSESDVSPNTALGSPSCASSDRRGAKTSPSSVPFIWH